jgi:hypothetical protein
VLGKREREGGKGELFEGAASVLIVDVVLFRERRGLILSPFKKRAPLPSGFPPNHDDLTYFSLHF